MSDIERGRLAFIDKSPYLFHALISLVPYETERISTCAVSDGMVLLYNPGYFDRLTNLQVATRLWHEVGHWVRRTFERASNIGADFGGPLARKANIAADLAINSSGVPGGWDFDPDGQLPKHYKLPDGLTFEEYFRMLPDVPPTPQGRTWGGQCGGMAGNPVDLELEQQVDRELGRSVIDQEIIAKDVAKDVQRYAAKGIGNMPSDLVEWANSLLIEPKVPWTTVLNSMVLQVAGDIIGGSGDYTYSRISRRAFVVSPNIILPGSFDQELIAMIALDTSGSMDIECDIGAALAESRNVLLALGLTEIWFSQIDAGLACITKKVRSDDLIKMEIHGRGGTDFRPAFEEAVKLKPKPCLLIYMTDGEGPAPDRPPPGIETIWCLFGERAPVPAPWGKVVRAT